MPTDETARKLQVVTEVPETAMVVFAHPDDAEIGSGGVGHLLVNWAHEHIDLSVMSLLTLAVPVVAVISAAVFLDESIVWQQVVGMAVVLVALGVVALQTTRAAPAPEVASPSVS